MPIVIPSRTRKRKRELIHEAVRVLDMDLPLNKTKKELQRKGWGFVGDGCSKMTFAKSTIVIKTAISGCCSQAELRGEAQQFKEAPLKLKRHLPTLYGYYKKALIQDLVPTRFANRTSVQLELWEKMWNLVDEFKLTDATGNWGLSYAGVIKFYDWVYSRY